MSTPNINLPLVQSGQTNISVAYNDAMQTIDALLQLAVEDKDLSTPPTTVEADVGKRWIVASSPTGAWTGHANKIALCVGPNLWKIIEAKEGFRAWVIDEEEEYRFTSGAWVL